MTKALSLLAATLAVSAAIAQPPAGSTGICKDGTYSSASTRSGACAGHKGVQTWYPTPLAPTAAAMPAPTPAAAATIQAAPAPAPAKKLSPAQAAAARPAAPGGGKGLVWVNTSSNVYHCGDDPFYGKTKAGSYMSEADAKAKGAHGDRGKTCTGQ